MLFLESPEMQMTIGYFYVKKMQNVLKVLHLQKKKSPAPPIKLKET